MDASLATNSGTTAELIDNYKTIENKLNIVEKSLENNANKVLVMVKDIAKVEKDIKQMSDKMDTAIMGRLSNRIEELQEAIDIIKEKLEKVAQRAHATGQPPGSAGSGAGEPQSEHYGQEGTEKGTARVVGSDSDGYRGHEDQTRRLHIRATEPDQ